MSLAPYATHRQISRLLRRARRRASSTYPDPCDALDRPGDPAGLFWIKIVVADEPVPFAYFAGRLAWWRILILRSSLDSGT
jgi:hypothetical protein